MRTIIILFFYLFSVFFAFSQQAFLEDFSNNKNGWSLSMKQGADNLGFISDDHLNLERSNPLSFSLYINQNIKVDVGKPFKVSTKMDSRFKGLGYQGLVLRNDDTGEYILFALDSFGVARGIAHHEEEDIELFNYKLSKSGEYSVNEFHLTRLNNRIIFRLGSEIIDVVKIPDGFSGQYSVGYYLSQKQSVKIDYLKITNLAKQSVAKSVWYYPSHNMVSTKFNEQKLRFRVIKPYMYKSLILKVNGKETNLHKLNKNVRYSKKYDFSMDVNLEKGVNTVVLEFLDHNDFLYRDYKTINLNYQLEDYKNHALLFATDNYMYWDDLNNPISDMDSLASILTSFYGFDVRVIKNASKSMITEQIKKHSERFYDKDEQLFVFFSGHGAYDISTDMSYFVCPDSKQGFLNKETLISLLEVEETLNKSSCKNICLMTDVCFGGQARTLPLESAEGNPGVARYFIASGSKEVSDGAQLNGQSPFMSEFYQYLVNGKAKKNFELTEWVFSLKEENRDVVFRKFGVNTELPGQNFKFIIK